MMMMMLSKVLNFLFIDSNSDDGVDDCVLDDDGVDGCDGNDHDDDGPGESNRNGDDKTSSRSDDTIRATAKMSQPKQRS